MFEGSVFSFTISESRLPVEISIPLMQSTNVWFLSPSGFSSFISPASACEGTEMIMTSAPAVQ